VALSQMLSSLYDTLFAPPGALEPEVGALDASSPTFESAPLSDTNSATDMDISWDNGFGTMNDFEIPASGHTTFESFGSSQGDLFGGSSDFL
jgi:hypothetical protein